jgi:hypothetical protein
MNIDRDLHQRLQRFSLDMDRAASLHHRSGTHAAHQTRPVASPRSASTQGFGKRWSALLSILAIGVGSFAAYRTVSTNSIVGIVPDGIDESSITAFEQTSPHRVRQELLNLDGRDVLVSRYRFVRTVDPAWKIIRVNGIEISVRSEGQVIVYRFDRPDTVEVRTAAPNPGQPLVDVQVLAAVLEPTDSAVASIGQWAEGPSLSMRWTELGRTQLLIATKGAAPEPLRSRVNALSTHPLTSPRRDTIDGWQIHASNPNRAWKGVSLAEASRLATELDGRLASGDGSGQTVDVSEAVAVSFDVGPRVSVCLRAGRQAPVCAPRYTGIVSRRIGDDWWVFGVGQTPLTVTADDENFDVMSVVLSSVPIRYASAVRLPPTASRIEVSIKTLGQYGPSGGPETITEEYRRPSW